MLLRSTFTRLKKARRPLFGTLMLLLCIPLLAACYNSDPAPDTTIDVGSAKIGTKITYGSPLRITNLVTPGDDFPNVTLEQPVISGPNAADFSYIASVASFPAVVDPSMVTCDSGTPPNCSSDPNPPHVDLTISCTPSAAGLREATLTVSTTQGQSYDYPLTCTGLGLNNRFNSTPSPGGTLDFGETKPGQTLDKSLSISNNGSDALTISQYAISGANAADFSVVSPAFPLNLPANSAAHEIKLQCKPATVGLRQATLTLTTNDPENPTVSYTLLCRGKADELYPAELTLSLTVSPDRLVANNPENLVAYSFKVKNIGKGKAEQVRLTLPVDVTLTLGFTQFDSDKIWVKDTANNEVVIQLPALDSDEQTGGTIIFRPSAAPAPVPGTKVTTRYRVRYDDPTGVNFERQSNAVEFVYSEGTNFSAAHVQFLSPLEATGKVGDRLQFVADFMAPDEPVTAWLTSSDGKSQQLLKVEARANPKGEFVFTVDTAGLLPGTYVVSVRGNRSEVQGNARLVVTAPALTPGIATLKVGEKATFTASFVTPGEAVSAWLTGPDGSSVALNGEFHDGQYRVTLDSSKLAPGAYLLVVKGNTSGLQGTATVTVEAAK